MKRSRLDSPPSSSNQTPNLIPNPTSPVPTANSSPTPYPLASFFPNSQTHWTSWNDSHSHSYATRCEARVTFPSLDHVYAWTIQDPLHPPPDPLPPRLHQTWECSMGRGYYWTRRIERFPDRQTSPTFPIHSNDPEKDPQTYLLLRVRACHDHSGSTSYRSRKRSID